MNKRFSSIIEIHRGPRRWVSLPYVLILAGTLILGLADGQTFGGVWPFSVLGAAFLVQLVWPTIAGWLVTFTGCVGLWVTGLFIVMSGPGGYGSTILWFAILVPGSLAPLYIFRPRSKDGAGVHTDPTEI